MTGFAASAPLMARRIAALAATLAMALVLSTTAALALTLDEAKSKGLVGERPDGYVGAVQPAPEVNQLVNRINTARRAKFQEIAEQNGTSVKAVATVVGQKQIERADGGTYVMTRDGDWVPKRDLK